MKVLHVDDDYDFLELSGIYLRKTNPSLKIDYSTSVKEALLLLEDEHYDLILSDYSMPENNGLEFLAIIRERYGDLPFIIFTGKSHEEVAIQALNLGANQYFQKIGDFDSLYTVLAKSIAQTIGLHQAQEKLQESEEKYRLLYSTMSEGLILHEIVYSNKEIPINYRIIDMNLKAQEIIGVTDDEVIDKLATEVYGVDSAPYLEIYTQVAETGKSISFEVYFEPMEKYFSVSAFSPKKGQFATLFSDVTPVKLMEKSLRESESKFRNYIKYAPVAILIINEKGDFLEVNPETCNLSGYSKEELLAMNLKNIKTPQIKGQEPLPLIVKLEESGRIDEFFSFFDKKDYIHYCKFSAIKLSDTHFLCFLVDITKLEKTKYKLEQERKLIRDIIDRNPSTITIVDRDGKIVFTNKAGEKILGITLQEIISREYKSPEWKITDLKGQPFHSKDLPFEIVKSTKKPTIVQHAIERANGERIFLSVSAIPIFDNEGKFNGMIATIEDITNRERN